MNTYLISRVLPFLELPAVAHVPQSISLVLITAMSASLAARPILDFRSKKSKRRLEGLKSEIGPSASHGDVFPRPPLLNKHFKISLESLQKGLYVIEI